MQERVDPAKLDTDGLRITCGRFGVCRPHSVGQQRMTYREWQSVAALFVWISLQTQESCEAPARLQHDGGGCVTGRAHPDLRRCRGRYGSAACPERCIAMADARARRSV